MKDPVDTDELIKLLSRESGLTKQLHNFINTKQSIIDDEDIHESDESSIDDSDSSCDINKLATFFMNEHGKNICDVLSDINNNLSLLVSLLSKQSSQSKS
mgnify:CR=1 FL=1